MLCKRTLRLNGVPIDVSLLAAEKSKSPSSRQKKSKVKSQTNVFNQPERHNVLAMRPGGDDTFVFVFYA